MFTWHHPADLVKFETPVACRMCQAWMEAYDAREEAPVSEPIVAYMST